MKTAAQSAANWKKRMAVASEDYKAGIERVSEAPGAAAAAAADRYAQGVAEAVASGKYAERAASVSLGDWKRLTLEKGPARLAQGAAAAEAKVQATMGQILSNIEAVKAEIDSMPKATLEDRIARSVAYMRGMAARPIRR